MTKYLERFARQKITVQGQEVEVLIMGPGSEVPIGRNLSEEMDRVSALIAYWGSVLSEAIAEKKEVDAWYRGFRANMTNEILSSDPKAPTWKVVAKIEASKGFLQHKRAIATSERNVVLCESMVRAFEKKSNQLQSKGAKMRTELHAQGMTTPNDEPEERGWNLSGDGSDHDDDDRDDYAGSARPSREDAIDRMEKINADRKKKKKKKFNKSKKDKE